MIFFLHHKYIMRKYTQWSRNRNQLHSLKIGKAGIYIKDHLAQREESEREKASKFFSLIQLQKVIKCAISYTYIT